MVSRVISSAFQLLYAMNLIEKNPREFLEFNLHDFINGLDFVKKMILKKSVLLSIFCLLTFTGASRAQDARKIMEGVYKQDTSRDTTWRGKIDAIDKNGTVRSKKFAMRKLGGLGSSKT